MEYWEWSVVGPGSPSASSRSRVSAIGDGVLLEGAAGDTKLLQLASSDISMVQHEMQCVWSSEVDGQEVSSGLF